MKISAMNSKTSLEVQDTDLLIIEDNEDTKSISVKDLCEYINSKNTETKKTKVLINETIDKVSELLQQAKFIISEKKTYMMNSWIGSTSGNIQICLKDMDTNKWLTQLELFELLQPENNEATKEYVIKVLVGDTYRNAVSYTIRDFNTEHENPEQVNEILSISEAGFIKAHFDELTQNEIANIKFDDIEISLEETEEYKYEFVGDKDSFANAVIYVEEI